MFKKLIMLTCLSFMAFFVQAEPLKYPVSFNELASSVAISDSFEILLPKDYRKDDLLVFKSANNPSFSMTETDDGFLVKLDLTMKEWKSFIIMGNPEKTVPQIEFFYGNGMIYKVTTTYSFSHEERSLAESKKNTVENQISDNLKANGYSRFLFMGDFSNKDGVTFHFTHLDYMRTHVLYVDITKKAVTDAYEDTKDKLLQGVIDSDKESVNSMFHK